MEKNEQTPEESPCLIALRETGRCYIPIRREEGEENLRFVDIMDRAGDKSLQLAAQLGVKITSNVRREENGGEHYLEVWVID